ncbi:MAG: DEAD/DEAH box helicase [Verrucomicrobiales bacterium]|nr:DEAD/DEAH box helicase [Verrucomicrobiales bacterium]
MSDLAEQLERQAAFGQLRIPDLWQQEAVSALRAGKDVVVHAPTGAGKTLVFELWSNEGRSHGQSIYTVPTRALANDKLAEWRGRGWNVGIATGDLADNLDAPVLVATLETQKNRLIRGDGPRLLVVDEYQMIGDTDRGLNYEIAVALAPPTTQLLLLSGSVHNPHQVVEWLRRLGRDAVLIRHEERPVPLEEVWAGNLNHHVPSEIRGYWPRYLAKALAEGLGPILVFAPRRSGAEQLASELARSLPLPDQPLNLTAEQKQWVGEGMARLLKSRIAFHHSGLSYAVRAGVIEPLAKAGQLRIVVATMGLAAGINFSLRSVALAGDSYRRDFVEHPLRSDEILQMFGRAGRRGIDEMGYVLVTNNEIRLRDGHPSKLSRSGLVDWGALLSVMHGAATRGEDPFAIAVRVQERLFTSKPIYLGVEEALKNPSTPCGLKTDAERARHVRSRRPEFRNSRGEWEPTPSPTEVPVGLVFAYRSVAEKWKTAGENKSMPAAPATATMEREVGSEPIRTDPAPVELAVDAVADAALPTPPGQAEEMETGQVPELVPALGVQAALERVGQGWLVALADTERGRVYGRGFKLADILTGERVVMVKWVRRLTDWKGRVATLEEWERDIRPAVELALAEQRTPVVTIYRQQHRLLAHVSVASMTVKVPVDRHGIALWRPPTREVPQPDCVSCALLETCRKLSPAAGTAALWRKLKLVDERGVPTLSGRVVAALSQTAGLAVAAALQEESYPLDELVYELANLDAGFRFAGEDSRWGGRLAIACQNAYGTVSVPGYLENGLPPKYGAGADDVARWAHRRPDQRHHATSEILGQGDVDRLIIEWRSLLRQIAHAPALDWARWTAFQHLARGILREVESPTVTELPVLPYAQTKRIDHKLVFRRW